MDNKNENLRTIKIKVKTAKALKNIKITQLETYDEIINRILQFFKENQDKT